MDPKTRALLLHNLGSLCHLWTEEEIEDVIGMLQNYLRLKRIAATGAETLAVAIVRKLSASYQDAAER